MQPKASASPGPRQHVKLRRSTLAQCLCLEGREGGEEDWWREVDGEENRCEMRNESFDGRLVLECFGGGGGGERGL